MRHFSPWISGALALSLAACGSSSSNPDASPSTFDAPVGPDAPAPDANPNPFFCLGQPLPTTAPATVTVSGKTEEIKNLATSPVSGSTVKAFNMSAGSPLATATSIADGTYTLPITTGGVPLDGYVVGHHDPVGQNTYLETYLYPPHPLAADEPNGVILLFTSSTVSLLSGVASVTQDPGKGAIGMVVADCNAVPLAGAKVTTEPAGTVVYDSGSLPSSSASMTDTDGRAYIFNLPPGTVNVRATINGMTLRAHDVKVVAITAGVTTTAVEP